MLTGASSNAIEIIQRSFPEGVAALQSDFVLVFRLGRPAGAKRFSLGLGAIEKMHVADAPVMRVAGFEIYFDVPDDYAESIKDSILHFNSLTSEFEAIKVVLADA